MASAYPGGLDTFATNKANATATTTDHPTHHNDLADAVNKIEAELGISPSGAEATVAARFTALGGGASFVGADNTSPTWLAGPTATAFYARKFTAASEGVLMSVGAYVEQTAANVWGGFSVALYTHDTDQPGTMLAISNLAADATSMILLKTSVATPRWLHMPLGAPIESATDYWMVVRWGSDISDIRFGYESGAGTGVSGIMTSGGQWWVEKGATGAGWSTTGNHEYMIRGLFLATNIA